MSNKRKPTYVRFWERVKGNYPDECWEWQGNKNEAGYGRFRMGKKGYIGAHRASYILNVGKIPEGKLVCHKCDNPGCVNPSHLFIGTHQDNTADMISKGRQYVPENPKNIVVNLRIPHETVAMLREQSANAQRSMSAQVRYLIRKEYDSRQTTDKAPSNRRYSAD